MKRSYWAISYGRISRPCSTASGALGSPMAADREAKNKRVKVSTAPSPSACIAQDGVGGEDRAHASRKQRTVSASTTVARRWATMRTVRSFCERRMASWMAASARDRQKRGVRWGDAGVRLERPMWPLPPRQRAVGASETASPLHKSSGTTRTTGASSQNIEHTTHDGWNPSLPHTLWCAHAVRWRGRGRTRPSTTGRKGRACLKVDGGRCLVHEKDA